MNLKSFSGLFTKIYWMLELLGAITRGHYRLETQFAQKKTGVIEIWR